MAMTSRSTWFRLSLLSSAATLIASPAWAQNPPAPPQTPEQAAREGNQAPETAPQDVAQQDQVIIITGTSRARAAFNTPLAVTSLGEARLQKIAASSQADILNTIPTLKGDAGGGEVASNIFVRGLPSGGQYQFTPLMYDGLPVLSTFGLNSSAYDVYYHNDFGVDRLEFVQGGVSNLFGPGSVAGLINYISKTGTDKFRGTAQVEVAEKGRVRTDAAVSGPLANNLYYALSGFYRYDEGPIKTDLKTKGYQLRGNLKYRFPDGSGSVTLYGQWINDQVQFYLPIPLNGSNRNRLPGNDGHTVYSVQFREGLEGLGFATPDGPFTTDAEEGVKTRGGQIALAFDKEFGDGWGINGRTKWSKYKHKFALWSDGDGIVNVPETQASFIANSQLTNSTGGAIGRGAAIPELRGIPLANARFTYADDGSVLPASALLFANRITDRNRPAHDFTGELNLTKEAEFGSMSHKFTLGGFYGNAEAKDVNVTTTFLAEFNNQPRLVNLVVTNPTTGAQTIISRNGLLNAGTASYVNNKAQAERYAFYGADQIDAGRFKFDIGFRWEHIGIDIRRERTATFVTDSTTPNLSQALRDVSWGNNSFFSAHVDTSEWAVAAGALYKLTDGINLYANASRGYFFPEPRAVQLSSAGVPQSAYSAEIIKQAELGVKIARGPVSATMAAFYTKLTNRRQILFINDPAGSGGLVERVNLVATESYGGDVTVRWQILPDFAAEGNITMQHAEYKQFTTLNSAGVPTPSLATIGKTIERQPDILYNAGLYYDDGRFDASLFTNYTDDVFTASANTIVLKSFNVVNLDAGYKFAVGGQKVRVGINVFNLLDTDATTEGSPRQDNNQTSGGQYFVGRPVLPRRVAARLTVDF
jgi:outer membrane receptor protein involved in Fe transport